MLIAIVIIFLFSLLIDFTSPIVGQVYLYHFNDKPLALVHEPEIMHHITNLDVFPTLKS